MQKELEASHPDLQIQILGVNEWGHEDGVINFTNGRDLPVIQDVDENRDRNSDVWTSWDITYRDVIVLDHNSEVFEVYNVTQNDLSDADNYDDLKQALIDAATLNPTSGDCNLDGAVDASDLGCVSDVDDRDVVLAALNTLPGDLDGNGEVAFSDFLVLSANFGKHLPHYTDGNIDLKDGIDFADFLVLSSNFGKTSQAADPEASAAISSIDAIFADDTQYVERQLSAEDVAENERKLQAVFDSGVTDYRNILAIFNATAAGVTHADRLWVA